MHRIEFFGDEIEAINVVNQLTGEYVTSKDELQIFPAKHYITPDEKLRRAVVAIEDELEERLQALPEHGKLLEAQRLEQRTRYDLDMLREVGYCNGVENYSRAALRARAGLDAVVPARLLPEGLAADGRRVARHAAAGARDVRRRPRRASSRWSSTASGCRRRSTTGR